MKKHTPKYRINRIMEWNLSKGVNKESVNEVYRNVINGCKYCHQTKGVHKLSCPTKKITITL